VLKRRRRGTGRYPMSRRLSHFKIAEAVARRLVGSIPTLSRQLFAEFSKGNAGRMPGNIHPIVHVLHSMNISSRIGPLLAGMVIMTMILGGLYRAPASSSAVPTIVQRASSVYASQVRGVISMQRHFTTQLSGGGLFHHGENSDSGQLMENGKFVKIAYYRIVRDGHTFSSSEVRQRADQTNKDWAAGKVFFKEPYDAQYIDDYAFGEPQTACSSCPSGTQAVSFTSAKRDAQHGSGTMYINVANAHVVRLEYTPYSLPPHATSGTVTEVGGAALPDLWYVVRINEVYTGHALVFSGTGTFTGIFDHFRRFASLAAGETALQNQAP